MSDESHGLVLQYLATVYETMNTLAVVRNLVEARFNHLSENVSTLYVCRPLLNQDEVRSWMRQVGFPVSIPDMHVTIVFSKKKMDWTAVPPQLDSIRVSEDGDLRTIERFGDEAIVLTFMSDDLQERWQEFIDAGASFDYDQYRPHITLTDEKVSKSLLKTEPYRGDLHFGPEVYQEIDTDR